MTPCGARESLRSIHLHWKAQNATQEVQICHETAVSELIFPQKRTHVEQSEAFHVLPLLHENQVRYAEGER